MHVVIFLHSEILNMRSRKSFCKSVLMIFFQLKHTNKFACEFKECGRRFRVEKELEIHMRKHKGEKPYVCSDCGKAYENRQDWKIHMQKHTGK